MRYLVTRNSDGTVRIHLENFLYTSQETNQIVATAIKLTGLSYRDLHFQQEGVSGHTLDIPAEYLPKLKEHL